MDKDKLRAKQLFSSMSAKEKLQHVARYYWPHILGSLALIAVVVSFGVSVHRGRLEAQNLYFGVTDPYTEHLRQPLTELAAQGGETLNYMGLMGMNVAESGGDGATQLICYLAADQLDLALCDRDTLDFLLQTDGDFCTVYPLEQTVLARQFANPPELYLVVRRGLTRAERAEAFSRLLVMTDIAP